MCIPLLKIIKKMATAKSEADSRELGILVRVDKTSILKWQQDNRG